MFLPLKFALYACIRVKSRIKQIPREALKEKGENVECNFNKKGLGKGLDRGVVRKPGSDFERPGLGHLSA